MSMSPKQVQSAVEELLKPLVGRRVMVGEVEGVEDESQNAPGIITGFDLSSDSGLLNITVRLDSESRTEVTLTLDELAVVPDEPQPSHKVLTVPLNDDSEPHQPQPVLVRYNSMGIGLHFPGYGDKVTVDEQGEPVYIEYRDGVPHVVIWADVNKEDPTHVISLADAAVTRRAGD